MKKITQKITVNLWFDSQAEEAVRFYTSIFKNSKIGNITRYGGAAAEMSGKPEGSILTIDFVLDGQQFVALNAGSQFKFNEAISLIVNCENQKEVDEYWSKLTADGGQEQPCGWLKDKFGLSWQVVPIALQDMLTGSDPAKTNRAMEALLQMKKIDINKLQQAYDHK